MSKATTMGEFIVNSRAWYSKAAQVPAAGFTEHIQVSIGEGEFSIVWHDTIRSEGRPVPQLKIFHDAWGLFGSHPELFAVLGRLVEGGACPLPDDVSAALKRHGLRDKTPKRAPAMGAPTDEQPGAPSRPRLR